MAKPWVVGALAFVAGATIASGAWTAFPSKSTTPVSAEPKASAPAEDDGDLRRANENLTASLHECDRKLAELGERPIGTAAIATLEPAAEPDAGSFRNRRRERGEPTKEDWERMAQLGVVRTRVPCIRDKPWTPSERVVDRLGLAPDDAEALTKAYEASNKRLADQIKPLCAQVLGSAEAAEKVGPNGCVEVINASARKSSADETKAALTRVAEVQAGKREAPKAGAELHPVEQLATVLTNESKSFEADLAQKLGPEDAKRLANAPELCTDRHMLRAGDLEDLRGRGGQGGRPRGGR